MHDEDLLTTYILVNKKIIMYHNTPKKRHTAMNKLNAMDVNIFTENV